MSQFLIKSFSVREFPRMRRLAKLARLWGRVLQSVGCDDKTSSEYRRFSFDEWSEHLLSAYKIFAAESHRTLINRSWTAELLQST